MSDEQKLDKWTALIIAIIIIAGSYVYVEKSKLNFKKEIILNNQIGRKQCLADAKKIYTEHWNNSCKENKLGANCGLDIEISSFYKKEYTGNKNECIKMYPAN